MNRIYVICLLLIFGSVASCQSPTPDNSNQFIDILAENNKENWTGSMEHWRWESGMLIGETTAENPIERSSFLIWKHEVEDFIFKVSFRISKVGNSGIYYRSEIGPEGYDKLLGYQADIDGANAYTGIVYENFLNRGHAILARRREFVRISESDSAHVFPISTLDHSNATMINDGGWNHYELIVQGSLIVQKLNDEVISMVEDRLPTRIQKGKFGFQLHQGPPMKVEFRDARYKNLSP